MIQDACVVRSGIPDAYDAIYKVAIGASGAPTLDVGRLPTTQFSIARTSAGLYAVTFPTSLGARAMSVNYDSKVITNAQSTGHIVNLVASAGTCSVVVVPANGGALVELANGSELTVCIRLEAL